MIVISAIGVANIITIGTLVFQAGGLVAQVRALTTDVESLLEHFTELSQKVAKMEAMLERRKL